MHSIQTRCVLSLLATVNILSFKMVQIKKSIWDDDAHKDLESRRTSCMEPFYFLSFFLQLVLSFQNSSSSPSVVWENTATLFCREAPEMSDRRWPNSNFGWTYSLIIMAWDQETVLILPQWRMMVGNCWQRHILLFDLVLKVQCAGFSDIQGWGCGMQPTEHPSSHPPMLLAKRVL